MMFRNKVLASLLILLALSASCTAVPMPIVESTPVPYPAPEASPTAQIFDAPLILDDEPAPEIQMPTETPDSGILRGSIYSIQAQEPAALYASPDSESLRLRYLPAGTLVMVSESLQTYTRVIAEDGSAGYVMTAYLVPADDAAFLLPENQPGPHVVVCQNNISLRDDASADANRTAVLPAGISVQALSFSGDFAYVYVPSIDYYGYLLAEYLHYGTISAASEPLAAGILGNTGIWAAAGSDYVALFEQPNIGSTRISTIPKGEQVVLLEYAGMFSKVSYLKQFGYVLSGYLTKPGEQDYEHELQIVRPSSNYGYEQIIFDLDMLQDKYSDRLSVKSIGQSELGRDIPVAVIGNRDAGRHVLIQAAIHGSEGMTALLAMAQIEYVLAHSEDVFGSGTIADALYGVCFHIIPMSNPDGVEISRGAIMNNHIQEIYDSDLAGGYTQDMIGPYLRRWKSNANGIDINRNFDSRWDGVGGRIAPSFEGFKGREPENQRESMSLAEYARLYPFSGTISYMTHGSEIYWAFLNNSGVHMQSHDLGRTLRGINGYALDSGENPDEGSFKDWAMEALDIPSVILKIGSRQAPLPLDEFASIWDRNKHALPAVARWVKGR